MKEFKEFVMRGNVVDMAVGIIVGASFGKITSSLVADVITPPLGIVLGGVDFTDLKLILKEATATAPAVTVKYGIFIQTIVDFLIVAFAMFLLIKGINALRKAPSAEPPAPTKDQVLLAEIRDLLRDRRQA